MDREKVKQMVKQMPVSFPKDFEKETDPFKIASIAIAQTREAILRGLDEKYDER